ncbi:hypothetical protein RA307_31650, partial [Xanthobacteraceae bacterium Astr-EGSB]|uniref:hypothetical protein n=1 Tax=Astrobacterium formosum TaxID=3069710 RepID=UPI0027B532EA|nr:hypothetical protein [Xanthobacteraceae bacterium Astr-EGSB]
FADISNATTYSTTDADVVASGMLTILSGLQPLTTYQVRARFISFNGYSCDWSLWQPVTTPDTRVDRDELSRSMDARLRQLEEQLPDILTVRKELDALSGAVNTQVTTLVERLGRVNIGAGARYNENKASVELAIGAIADIDSALSQLSIDLTAEISDMGQAITAGGRLRFVTAATPAGAIASVAIEVNVGTPETPSWSRAGIYLDAIS